jgi:hypothetical protein
LLKWISLAYQGIAVSDFQRHLADPLLSSETDRLGAFLFAKEDKNMRWAGKTMIDLLARDRKAMVDVVEKYQYSLNP